MKLYIKYKCCISKFQKKEIFSLISPQKHLQGKLTVHDGETRTEQVNTHKIFLLDDNSTQSSYGKEVCFCFQAKTAKEPFSINFIQRKANLEIESITNVASALKEP